MRKLALAIACASLMLPGPTAGAEEDPAAPRATLSCDRVDQPGRVRCDVEARVGAGFTISWGDVLLRKTPAFVGVLRGRIGPREATARDPDVWRWALALVAKDKGKGDVEGLVRLVVCKDGKCEPREVSVTGHVVVGGD